MAKLLIVFSAFLLCSCNGKFDSFHDSAFKQPSENVIVLASNSEVSDNLFRKEYSWLINAKEDQDWLAQVSSYSFEKKEYEYQSMPTLLTNKFPEVFSKSAEFQLYLVGEGPTGREHYLLTAKDNDHAIYYIATI
ncbi:hypothetical protein GCM10008090_35000 [Arenicella chitinivorans]|uniref:Uncharacterized protein n=1 Tax=Arenicella chitinivorans TaxID=1329800 RepID=A0A918S2S9_9GAMM|nr:hypothetical protein [Arenicella chitinivorans]GHA22159.1 hypothetical protein GCM10008090_35000 [Arenicella chitinivorans]